MDQCPESVPTGTVGQSQAGIRGAACLAFVCPYTMYNTDGFYWLVLQCSVWGYHMPWQTRGRRNGSCRTEFLTRNALNWMVSSFLRDWLFGQVTGSSLLSPQPWPVLSYCHWPLSQPPRWELQDNSAPVVDGPAQEAITRGNLQVVVLRLWTSWMGFCCWGNLQMAVLHRWRSQTDIQCVHGAQTG